MSNCSLDWYSANLKCDSNIIIFFTCVGLMVIILSLLETLLNKTQNRMATGIAVF
jgi:hypothetical protein